MVNRGINKLLYEKRLELHYSLFEAAIKLDIYKFQLKLIEKGYLGISKKLKEMFIIKYKLPADFFDDDLGYPVVIDEVKKKDHTKLKNITASWVTRAISLLGIAGFAVMTFFGIKYSKNATVNVPSFFSSEIIKMREEVKTKGKYHEAGDSESTEFIKLVGDSYNLYTNTGVLEDKTKYEARIGFFTLDENLVHNFYQAGFEIGKTDLFGNLVAEFESRCYSGKERIKFAGFVENVAVLSISADLINNQFKYNYVVSPIFGEGDNNIVPTNSVRYDVITAVFEQEVSTYKQCLKGLFNDPNLDVKDSSGNKITYENYHSILLKNTKDYERYSNKANALTICGIIFSIIFLALLIASIFIKTRVVTKLSKENKVENATLEEKQGEIPTRELRPNLEFRPFIPESLLRIAGVVILFIASFGLYDFVNSVLNFDIISSINIYNRLSVFNSLSSIAIVIIFFTKMDIVISKKNVFLTNYVMFFAGLIYYFILMTANYSLTLSESIYAKISKQLLNVLPGNFIWGILAFNLLAQLLFTVPDYIKGNKKREVSYHSLTAIPILYLLASAALTICEKSFDVNLPLWFKTLFFTKSLPIIFFAIIYCLSIFVYKRLALFAYGEKKYEIIKNGSRYYFIKNLIAVFIIVVIGAVELIVHFTVKDGRAFGFGENYLFICAAPFIIFYHPHRGARNGLWDLVFMILNGTAMMIGVLLLANSIINYIILI